MKLILFDFDGTLTTKDSFLEFIKFTHGSWALYLGILLLSPILIGMKLGVISNEFAKSSLLSLYYKGKSHSQLNDLAESFYSTHLSAQLRRKGLEEIKRYQADNQTIALVSASVDIWLKPFAKAMNLILICTEAEFKGDRFSGRFSSMNCIGPEKAKRIRSHFNLDDYEEIIAYGDTRGDREMLELADLSYYKPFRT